MYPFKNEHLYARNQWYVLGWSDEFANLPQRRVVMNEPILIYRAEDGGLVALADRCPHRNYPLSKGRLRGDLIECGYHGITFDRTGACVRIPSQRSISSACRVRPYAVVEKWKWVWIWMGEAAKADPNGIPDHEAISLTDGDWLASVGFSMPLKARYQLLNENLLDLTHTTFLHPESIGTAEVAESKVVFEEYAGFMRDGRYMFAVTAPDLFREPLQLEDRIDRDLLIDYYPPGLHVGWERFKRCGVADGEPTRNYGHLKVYHALTPETDSTTHYFFAFARTFARSNETLTDRLREGLRFVVGQDRSALEALEQNLQLLDHEPTEVLCRSDAGAIRGRRLMEELIAAETSTPSK
jgi:vanillate O-demethylase monooxygenase subunit